MSHEPSSAKLVVSQFYSFASGDLLSNEQNDKVSDTTDDHSSNAAWPIKKTPASGVTFIINPFGFAQGDNEV